MEQYHVLMFITRQQELAIRSLFWQQGWGFYCKALPPALRDNAIKPLLQDYGGETDTYSGQCSVKPYSYYEDICRADDTKYYFNKHGFNHVNGPEMINGYSNHCVEKYVQNIAEQSLAKVNSVSDLSFDDLHNGVDTPEVNTQTTLQNNSTCIDVANLENDNYTDTSNVNKKVTMANGSDSDKIGNVKTVEHDSLERNLYANRVKTDKANQSQHIQKQGSSNQCKETLDTFMSRTCIKRNITTSSVNLNPSNSVNNANNFTGKYLTVENEDSDKVRENDSACIPLKSIAHDIHLMDKNSASNPEKLSLEDVTVTVSKTSEVLKDKIVDTKAENINGNHEDDGYKLTHGTCSSKFTSNIEESTIAFSSQVCNTAAEKQFFTGTVGNAKVESHNSFIVAKKLSRNYTVAKEVDQIKEIDKLTEPANEKGRTDKVLKHSHRRKSMKMKVRKGITAGRIEISSGEPRLVIKAKTSHRHKLIQKKLRKNKFVEKMLKDEKMETGSSAHKINKQKHKLVKKFKIKSSAIANENSSISKENSATASDNHSKRTCFKCGKELGRKKICYDCELTCKYCGKSYANYKTRGRRGLLKVHIKSHEGDKTNICGTCGKAFSHIDYMKRHIKLVHAEEEHITFLCKICSKTFKNNHTLQIHIRSIHNTTEESLQCHICGSIFKRKGSLMAHHRRVHVDTNAYKCEHCGTMWKSSDSLRVHIKTVHMPRVRTVCYICGAMLLSADMFKKHIMRHKNKRTYQCTKCDKRFYTSHEARQHFRVHSGAKPFQCHLCNYASAVKGNLTKHMKIHRNGDSIPKHNYTGHDYDVHLKEEEAEFVKLDDDSVEDEDADGLETDD